LEEGRTTEELETMLLSMRLSKSPNDEELRTAFNDHLDRRANSSSMRKVDIAPKPESKKKR
jgi:hypothetical protein